MQRRQISLGPDVSWNHRGRYRIWCDRLRSGSSPNSFGGRSRLPNSEFSESVRSDLAILAGDAGSCERWRTIYTRQCGLLQRLSVAMPAFMNDSLKLEPGSSVQLPIGSARVTRNDPMSDWIIADCSIPSRADCGA
jgi:hypothetical protein